MTAFTGFPAGKNPYVPVPEIFFNVLLPEIEDMAELKVTLHLFWLLAQKQGNPRCVSDRELLGDRVLLRGLKRQGDPRPVAERLLLGLEQAVARGSLLRIHLKLLSEISSEEEVIGWYFFNTARSRKIVKELQGAEMVPASLLEKDEQVAQAVGARKVVITDINPYRLDLARKVGIHHVVDASKETLKEVMGQEGMKEGFDVGLEMSGSAVAFRDMIDTMNNGGKIAILGISPTGFEIDWNKVIFKMLTLKGIYGREMFETWYKMIALVQGPLDVTGLITHRIGIDDYISGFEAMKSGSSGKVVMDW